MRGQQGRSPQGVLRHRHEQRTLNHIRTQAPVSRTQLAALTGLSAQAVGSIVRDLIDDGLVEELPMPRQDGPGAPPVGLQLRPDGAYAFGFGLERDSLRGVVLDLAGGVRWQMSAPIAPHEGANDVLARVVAAVRTLANDPEWGPQWSRVCGLGMAVPGPIHLREGTMVHPPNFPGWHGVRVSERLSGALGLPVLMDNAATASAMGIEWLAPRRRQPFLYCYWGMGVGGGLVLEHDAYRGTSGNAVEIGHVVVDPFGHACQCGGVGCLEAEASAVAVLRDAAAYGDYGSVEEVVAAAATLAPLRTVLTRAAELLAAALVSVVNIVDVGEVVLGGAHFAAVAPVFLPILRRRIGHQAFRRSVEPVRVRMSDLGEEANAIGAAALVFQALLPRHQPRGRHEPARMPPAMATIESSLILPEGGA